VTNVLPYAFGLFCGSKTNDVETRMSVVLGLTFGFYLLYYPFMILIGWFYGGWFWSLFALLIPFFGYFSVLYLDTARRYHGALKVRQTNKNQIKELLAQRKSILDSLEIK